MIEKKLYQAAEALPQPRTDYLSVEETAKQATRKHTLPSRRTRLAAALSLVILLLGVTTVGAATTEIDMSMWATYSYLPMAVENKLGIRIPRAIGNSDYRWTANMHTVPKGTTYLEAILKPVYRWYSINYVDRVEIAEEQNNGYRKITWEDQNPYTLNIGSTKNELWKYTFCFSDDGEWIRSDILPETYHTEEYNGITLYCGTRVCHYEPIEGWEHTSQTTYHVVWVDEAHQVLFSLSTEVFDTDSTAAPPELLEYAKQIIDLNKHP